MIIGITGGTGCGKTTVLEIIRELGGIILDCDAIYHELLQTDHTLLRAIEARFPGSVEGNVLQRKKLGALVFNDKKSLEDLNRITHNAVKTEVTRKLTPAPALAAIDAIGLFESGLDKLCQLTIAVTAPKDARIARLMARDGITQDYAQARINAQPDQEEFIRRCDYCLENNSTTEVFREKCLAFFYQLGIINKKP